LAKIHPFTNMTMQRQNIFGFTGCLLACIAGLFSSVPGQAEPSSPKFYCGQSQNIPTTLAKTRRGSVPIIRWQSTAFGENYPPAVRCQKVSERFQAYYEDDSLNFLSAAYLNKQPVICAVPYKGAPCKVLFTLKPGSDPKRTLRQLLSIRDRTTTIVLNESFVPGADSGFVDMNDFLNTAPVEPESSAPDTGLTPAQPEAQPSPSVPPSAPANSESNSGNIW
jgi:Circadian oscillating protein COP23